MNVYYTWGRYEEALTNCQSLSKYYDKIDDLPMRARMLTNEAAIHQRRGDHEQALNLYNQSLEIARKQGDLLSIAVLLNDIALIHRAAGNFEQAIKLYEQSLEIKKAIGDQHGIILTLNNVGWIYDTKKDYPSHRVVQPKPENSKEGRRKGRNGDLFE